MLEEVKKIISIKSITYDSNREIVDYLCELVKPLNVNVELDKGENFGKEQFNFIVRKGPDRDDGLIFNTHLDTVSPGDYSLWDKTGGNPFRATTHDNKIYGLGTADVKLDILCKIKALSKFKDVEFKKPFTLVGTFGEESGLIGAKKILADKRVKGRYAVVGEPSNLSIVYAHKGHMVLEVTLIDENAKKISAGEKVSRIDCLGKSAHSSTPHLGVNAILKGFQFIKKQMTDLQLISFTGGSLINMVPDRATLLFKSGAKVPAENLGEHSLSQEKVNEESYVFSQDFLTCVDLLMNVFEKQEKVFRKSPMAEFDPPTSIISIGIVKTEGNKVILSVGVRTLPDLDSSLFVENIKKQINAAVAQFKGLASTVEVLRESKSMMTNPDSALISEAKKILRKLSLQDMVVTKSTCTEASVYKEMGADTIIWGPGISVGNVHRPNEYNYVHHLEYAVKFYEHLIETFCVKGAG